MNYAAQFAQSLRPEKVYSVSEWADRYRFLSGKASAEPGRWRTARTPYLKRIMDCLSTNDPCQRVVLMKGAQVGGTEAGNNWLGYIIDHAPAPTLAVQPTIALAKRNSKQRIDPLIDESPALRSKVADKRTADSSNTLLEKDFPGGTLVLAGANSAAGLRSMPARFVFFDEPDAYPGDIEGEGSPVKLAEARTRTFAKRKFLLVSTPTIAGLSIIENEFNDSNRQYYHVPCPDCGEYQVLKFARLRWTEGDSSTTRYYCEHCEYAIENWQKTTMLNHGKWVAEDPDHKDGKVMGFHLSSLYSPVGWFSWEEIAQDWLDAQGDQEKLKTFVNTVLGETWKEKAERPNWQRLYERRETYERNRVPKGVGFLTCGVDVQRDRLELEIVGWSRDKISYSIDYRIIDGDTSTEAPWRELDLVLTETWPTAANEKLSMGIKLMAVDSGYNTQTVYNWVRKYPSTRVVAIKGSDTLNLVYSLPKAGDINSRGKTIRRGLKVWPLGVSVIKSELYGWLRQPMATEDDEKEPVGFCHFPEYGPDYFKMLTAEELVTKYVKGYKKTEWQKIRERNEALDCRVYARGAAAICGIDRFTEDNWKKLTNSFQTATIAVNKPEPTKKRKRQKRESNWL
jgi:phage terminase large subunit GpA-like protein